MGVVADVECITVASAWDRDVVLVAPLRRCIKKPCRNGPKAALKSLHYFGRSGRVNKQSLFDTARPMKKAPSLGPWSRSTALLRRVGHPGAVQRALVWIQAAGTVLMRPATASVGFGANAAAA
jgi:hypothetical protein